MNPFILEWEKLIYNEALIPSAELIKLSITCGPFESVRMGRVNAATEDHVFTLHSRTAVNPLKGAAYVKLETDPSAFGLNHIWLCAYTVQRLHPTLYG